MSDVTIVVDDAAVRQLLDRAPSRIDTAIRLSLKDATSHLEDKMRTYPPPPDAIQGPRSHPVRFATRSGRNVSFIARTPGRYVRTYTLQRSWHSEVTGNGIDMVGKVYSSGEEAPYNRYVQDATRQAEIHRSRWTNTIQNVSQREAGAVQQMFNARIRTAIG